MSYERTNRESQKRSRILRWSVLGIVLVGMTAAVTAHQFIAGSGKPVGVDALCPFGGLETLFTLISGAGFVEKTAASALVLMIGTLVMALVMRRSFCGQVCPLGALQGLFGALGGKIWRRRPHIPVAIDRSARYLKYVVLAVFTFWTWQAAELVMRPYDPWAAYAHLTSAEVFLEFGVGLAVLGVALAGSLVYDRFFCKYLCPTGALLGLLSKFSVLGIKRDVDACTNCSACDKACPMDIEVSTMQTVTSSECLSCNECVNVCPAAGALEVKATGGRSIGPAAVTGMLVGLLVVVIGVSTAAGAFAWRMPSLGEAIEQQRESAGSDPAAAFDSGVIKGYMSMKEISEASGIPEQEFATKWGVPDSDLDRPMKDIKDQYDFSPDDVKVWVVEELAK